MAKTVAEALGQFTVGLKFESLPQKIVEHVKFNVMNTIGLCLASSKLDAGKVAANVVQQMRGRGEATVIASGYSAPAANAAFANGVMAHVLDYDDTHSESFVHAGPPVVPAALAMAERQGIDGKAFITATAAGIETALRIGIGAPGQLPSVGFHATSVCGTFGAAVAAAKILGLSEDQIVNALGIGGSQASGIYEFFSDGSWVKQFHAGWAAHSGIIASLLAEKGMNGPRTVFEGRFGFYRTHLGGANFDLQRVVGRLGKTWEILRIAYKPYPCAVVIHPFLYCASEIRREHKFATDDITEVTCTVPGGMVPLVCEPVENKLSPRSAYDSKFSLQFAVAAMLVDGKVDIATFSKEKIRDSEILGLTKRVRYVVDRTIEYPRRMPGRVLVKMKNHKSYKSSVETNPGGPDFPMSKDEHIAKFKSNASVALGKEKMMKILAMLDNLQRIEDMRALMKLCR